MCISITIYIRILYTNKCKRDTTTNYIALCKGFQLAHGNPFHVLASWASLCATIGLNAEET